MYIFITTNSNQIQNNISSVLQTNDSYDFLPDLASDLVNGRKSCLSHNTFKFTSGELKQITNFTKYQSNTSEFQNQLKNSLVKVLEQHSVDGTTQN